MYEKLEQTVALCAAMPRTVEHLQVALGLRRTAAYSHVARGVELGLLSREAPLRGEAALIVATREGQRWSGLGLEVARVGPALARHWLACSELWLSLRGEFPDARVISEAELRFEEALTGKAVASAEVGELPGGGVRLHRPDLVVANGGRPLAIEVELTPKAPRRLETIVRGWRRAACVEGVRYYVRPGKTARAVERAIRAVHAAGRVELHEIGVGS